MAQDEIAIIGGYCTITGALVVLKQEGVKVHRRTVLNWLRRNRVPTTLIGATRVFPQAALRELVEDYKPRG